MCDSVNFNLLGWIGEASDNSRTCGTLVAQGFRSLGRLAKFPAAFGMIIRHLDQLPNPMPAASS